MHVGNLRSALYEFLIAKHGGGDFILRIEDTDQERFVEDATQIIYRTLARAGLLYDEGPDKDGGYGPYVQSERAKAGIYWKYARELIRKGEAYYCFCGKERLAALKTEVVEGKEIMVYDKHCLSLGKEEIEANLASGKPYVVRQKNPAEGTTTFQDELYGEITVNNAELDDMVLMKSDGYPTYNFANVVDDHTMDITHVVRGNEYLSSSPKYVRLYQAFGWKIPEYVHLPLLTDENHKKLSKRSGHSSFEDLLEQGFLPEAVVNYIALLGWSAPDSREIFSLEELIREFDYRRIGRSPAVFDMVKLKWMNGEYLKAMEPERFYQMALPYLKAALSQGEERAAQGFGEAAFRSIAAMVKTRIEIFPDIAPLVDFFVCLPEYDSALYAHKKMKTDTAASLQVLREVLPMLEKQEDYRNDALYQRLLQYIKEKGYQNGYVMWPVRTAVSGKQVTPAGATQIMEILGKEESLRRIRKGIEKLTSV
jgi:glutamyl-tRNA synthetase